MGTRNRKIFINPHTSHIARQEDEYRYFGKILWRSRNFGGDSEECSRIVQNANKLFNFRESNIRVRLLAFSKKQENTSGLVPRVERFIKSSFQEFF